jgi:hypothetical protein
MPTAIVKTGKHLGYDCGVARDKPSKTLSPFTLQLLSLATLLMGRSLLSSRKLDTRDGDAIVMSRTTIAYCTFNASSRCEFSRDCSYARHSGFARGGF